MSNPLLEKFDAPFETAPFDKIKNEHFLPAVQEGIAQGKADVDKVVNNPDPATFENTIEALDKAGTLINRVSSIFFNLNSAETNDEIQALAQEISPLLSQYSNDISLNEALFQRIKTVYEQMDSLDLSPEQQTLLSKTYKGFSRNGANLDEEAKEKLRNLDMELSKTSLLFGENVLKETNAFELVVENEEDLAGLPQGVKDAAKMTAEQKEKEGWVFTLDYPSYVPFMMYAENRELRKELFMAFASRAFKDNEFNNEANVQNIVALREERAKLLGYNAHSDFVLEERMAGSAERVFSFLDDLLVKAKPVAEQELETLKAYAQEQGHEGELARWDASLYTEKLKKEKFSIDDETLKPYFKLENVVNGVFEVANRLFNLSFTQRNDIPVYHEEVTTYEVKDNNGRHIGVFYADFFPREGKRAGAWMTSYRSQNKTGAEEQRPHVSIVCNFTKPTEDKPSLLTFNEVTTLFHEFGHALHGLLADTTYEGLSGTSVYWDFVELPSQVLENWCYEPECLALFATHYETGEPIPQEFIQKIKDSANFMEGMATLRQLSFGKLDMAWHSLPADDKISVSDFEKKAMEEASLMSSIEGVNMSCAFSHIFQGGYSSGYYSYKWAEVLDADAFAYFQEKGIFNEEVAESFQKNILSAGGSEHPMTLYKRFRGQEPTVDALLKRAGLA
ncbi:MAG: M3 family metallopeptidase [Cytophagales bacterium]|nr:M3 family metallopeptidase [Cytophagales bacterium]